MSRAWILVLATVFVVTALSGCVSDTPVAVPQDDVDEPVVWPVPEVIGGLEPLAQLELQNANEITLRDTYAYVSGYSGTYIVDISDPAAPELVGEVPCRGIHVRTVQLEARLVMTLSYQGDDNCPDAAPAGGVRLVDVTDPAEPVIGPQVPLTFGSHTHTPYGDTGILYNSAYNLYTSILATNAPQQHQRSEIIDITDFDAPKVVDEFVFPVGSASPGCHDIWPEPERERAVCAGITETQIWDLKEPLAPRIMATIHNPQLSIHHTATTNDDGSILILGDEWTGAIGPGCFDGGTAPIGALWFYDISDPASPKKLSYLAPPHQGPEVPCTAHNFNVIEGHDILVAAFFKAGTVLVDFSDPTTPKVIERLQPAGTDVWASYYHNGHVYTGDRGRGLDVFTLVDAEDADDHDHDHEGAHSPFARLVGN